jgi:phospholipase/lecithinase/hemolysin
VPDAPYLIGLFHFSNGRTWIERLATDLGMFASAKPALLFPRVYTNYAVGRSRARPPESSEVAICKLCDLTSQVNRFLKDFRQTAPSDALYVVFVGANDLFDAISALPSDLSGDTTAAIIEEAISATLSNILALYSHGARTFLVANLPNVAITPAVILQEPSFPGLSYWASFFSEQYNAGLKDALDGLEMAFGEKIQVIRLDVFEALQTLVASPGAAGFSVVDKSCLNFGVVQGAICAHPNAYLFWDGIHPTTAGHDYLSEQAKETLEKALDTR